MKKTEGKIVNIEVINGTIYPRATDIMDGVAVAFRSREGRPRSSTEITRVVISESAITRIPKWVLALTEPSAIFLDTNEIATVTCEEITMLAKMKHLRLLQLSYNHIAEIPENINEIQFLEELYIGDNGIKSIPDTVANLDQLRLLSVQPGYPSGVKLREPNQFSEFPTALLRMKGLRELAIARASITGFPKGITSELVALEKLDISKNPITALPGWLFPGSKMRNLVASHTSIRALPGCVTRWKHLEGLDLSFSNLEVLPEAIGQCKKLRELRVRGSKIDALPESIGDCEGLEVLDIARTKVREIPASLGLCWRLRELDMSETMVDTLPTSLGTCTNLECIKFRMLKDIPPEIEGLAGRYRKLRLDQDLDTARAAEYETRMRSIEQDEPEESDEEE